ncbi:MAG: hypothetical protein ACI9ZT_000914 [Gammaproteobacteria bacterium]|jgi:hypothetical protein
MNKLISQNLNKVPNLSTSCCFLNALLNSIHYKGRILSGIYYDKRLDISPDGIMLTATIVLSTRTSGEK